MTAHYRIQPIFFILQAIWKIVLFVEIIRNHYATASTFSIVAIFSSTS
ncbi:MAG: hypothetical protein ACJA1A_003415, partial [Saprospiraceae bacterium]